MKKLKRCISALLAVALTVSMLPPLPLTASAQETEEDVVVTLPTVSETSVPETEAVQTDATFPPETTAATEAETLAQTFPTETTEASEVPLETEISSDPEQEALAEETAATEPAEGIDFTFSSGVLTITGSGPMKDYTYYGDYGGTDAPWDNYINSATKIVIEDGVESVGTSAFYGCANVTELVIGDDVQTIGAHAFSICNKLAKVTLGTGLKTVDSHAFNGCVLVEEVHTSDLSAFCGIDFYSTPFGWSGYKVTPYLYVNGVKLTNLVIPEDVTRVGRSFIGYSALESVTIPSHVTELGGGAFAQTGISSIFIPKTVTTFGSGIFGSCMNLTSVTLEDGLTEIAPGLVSRCSALETLTIPDSVVSIGDQAFFGCTSLQNLTLPENLQSIGKEVFYGCTAMTSIVLPEKIQAIPDKLFYGCDQLTNVSYSDTITSIGKSAFQDCVALTSVSIPETVTEIGSAAFSGCTLLDGVTLPAGLQTVSDSLFYNCTALSEIQIPDKVTGIGANAFYKCTGLQKASLPAALKTIGDYAFYNCAALQSVSFPDGLEQIGASAYNGCSALPAIVLPDTVTDIGTYAFYGCGAATELKLSAALGAVSDYAFQNCSAFESLMIPASVTAIGVDAFNGCTKLSRIDFVGNAPTIDKTSFKSVSATCYYPKDDETYTAEILTSDFGGELIWTYEGKEDELKCGDNLTWELTEDGVLKITGTGNIYDYSIDDLAYAPWYEYKASITAIEIGEGVTGIGDAAFYNCDATTVTIPDEVTYIGDRAFEGINAESITLPSSLKEIGQRAFYLSYLTAVTVPEGVTTVGTRAFGGSNLVSAVLPDSLTYIPDSMFAGCTDLLDVDLPAMITTIGTSAFQNCYSLNSMVLPEGLVSIGDDAFAACGPSDTLGHLYDCNNFTSISLPDTLTSLGESVFYNCQSLSSVIIPDGIVELKSATFGQCRGLRTVSLPPYLTSIAEDVFLQNELLSSITFRWSPPAIDAEAFSSHVWATCYYPADNSEWTESHFQNYGAGKLTWTPISIDPPGPNPGENPDDPTTPSEDPTDPSDDPTDPTTNTEPGGNVTDPTEDPSDEPGGTGGSCGTDSTWEYDAETFVLKIIGAGEMDDYTADTIPWEAVADKITHIIVSASITHIGDYAFSEFPNLEKITFLGSAPTFGDNACYNTVAQAWYPGGDSSWTQEVRQDYGGDITWIAYGSPELENSCGDNLAWEFDADTGTLTIRGTGPMADFERIDALNLNYPWADFASDVRQVVLDEGVTSIGAFAFCGLINLNSADLPDSITAIGNSAFENTSSLSSLTIPDGVTSIGDFAFGTSGITGITLPGSLEHIGEELFYHSGLENAVLSEGITEISKQMFLGCYSLASVSLPETLTTIGEEAFYDCCALESISIPASVTSIGSGAFQYCFALKEISVDAQNAAYSSDDSGFLFNKDQTVLIAAPCGYEGSYVIPGTVTEITEWAFEECSIRSLIVPGSVVNIPNGAFSNCGNLSTVRINEGVQTISYMAFSSCRKLTNLYLPDSLTSIGEAAFVNCTGLTTIRIPACVVTVEESAFSNCQNLTEIIFEGSTPALASDSFSGVTATACYPSGNESWTEEVMQNYGGTITWVMYGDSSLGNGCGSNLTWELDSNSGILTIRGTGPMADFNFASDPDSPYPPWYDYADTIETVVVESGVTTIGDCAFRDLAAATSVTIPDTVTSIGIEAFAYTRSLTEFTIPDSVTTIKSAAFSQCGLISITIPGSVKEIGVEAFNRSFSLETVVLSEGITEVSDAMFLSCLSLGSVTLPESLKSIGSHAFYNCHPLPEIAIPASVETIGDFAFLACGELTQITVDSQNPYYSSDSFGCLFNKEQTVLLSGPGGRTGSYTIPDTVTEIASCALSHCSISELTVPGSVKTIADCGFMNCLNLSTVVLQEGMETIGESSFEDCTALKVISLPETLVTIGHGAFSGCSALESVTIPASVQYIRDYAFSGCDALTEIYFEGDAPSFVPNGSETESDCFNGITATAYYPAGNETWTEEVMQDYGGTITWVMYGDSGLNNSCGDNLTWELNSATGTLTIRGTGPMADFDIDSNTDTPRPPWYDYTDSITKVVVESGVTTIGDCAFRFLTTAESVTLPDTVTSIGVEAFAYTPNLAELTIPDSVTTIKDTAFCTSGLVSITIPGSVTEFGTSIFSWSDSLESVVLSEGVTAVSDYMFMSCRALTSVTLPESLKSIGSYAFCNCLTLPSITIPAAVETIGEMVFDSCSELWKINVHYQNAYYSSDTFGCLFDKDQTVLLESPRGRNGIYTVPNTVTEIADWAFSYSSIYELTIPGSVKTIGDSAFEHSTNLSTVILKEGVETIGESSFGSCTDLELVILPETLVTIGHASFSGCSGLEYVRIPASVKNVKDYAFSGCTALSEIHFEGDAPSFAADGFITDLYTFFEVTATAYYPSGNETWTEEVMQDYQGTITWEPYDNHMTWSFDEESGTLTVSGNGDIPNYPDVMYTPWYLHRSDIKRIEVQEGITGLTANCFASCYQLTDVIIPASVEYIDYDVFGSFVPQTITFAGDAPEGLSNITYTSSYDGSVYCPQIIFYPAGNATWTEEIMAEVPGDSKWISYDTSVTSGTCGDGVSWSMDTASGTLTISGSGAMDSWDHSETFAPWLYYMADIQSVVVERGVTVIGSHAFHNCPASSITFLGDAPKICQDAFYGLTCVAYYPGGNTTWSKNVRVQYGGSIDWVERGSVVDQLQQITEVQDDMTMDEVRDAVQNLDFDALLKAMRAEEGLSYIRNLSSKEGVYYEVKMSSYMPFHNSVFHSVYGLNLNDMVSQEAVLLDEPSGTVTVPDGYDSSNALPFSIHLDALGGNPVTVPILMDLVVDDGNLNPNFIHVFYQNPETGTPEEIPAYAYWSKVGWTLEFVIEAEGDYLMAVPEDGVLSGTCGDNATWSYSYDGTLTISGTGAVYYYDVDANRPPWYNVRENVSKIVIGDGITALGDYALYDCRFVDDMEIPAGVAKIGSHTFEGIGECYFHFLGDAPEFHPDSFYSVYSSFVYYHADKAGWEEVLAGSLPDEYDLVFVAVEYSGSCSDTVSWSFDTETGTMTISGTGDIPDYDFYGLDMAPWGILAPDVRKLVIEEGITGIGMATFHECENLEEIQIADTVSTIGDCAICLNKIPEFTIPAGVTRFSGSSFGGNPVAYHVDPANETYATDENGVVFTKDMSTLVCYPTGRTGGYAVPDGVTTIYGNAFSGAKLDWVTLPDTLITIGTAAFSGSSGFESIVIPDSVTAIGEFAFANLCDLKSITIGRSVQTIGYSAFDWSKSIRNVKFLGDCPDIEDCAFMNVEATVLYPADNETYTEEVMQDYDGTLTWVAVAPGQIVDNSRTLSLDGVIYINQYALFEGFEDYVTKDYIAENGGMLIWSEALEEADAVHGYGTPDDNPGLLPVLMRDGVSYEYMARTDGIAVKEYADEQYLRVYLKLQDGSYVYGPLKEFSVQAYCEGRLANSSNEKLKNLCAAMLHFGAAAQTNFGYNTGDLANANILTGWPVFTYDPSWINLPVAADTTIAPSASVSNNGRTLSLDGAIVINYYFGATFTPAKAELLIWDGVEGTLTESNFTDVVELSLLSSGEYFAQSREFAAKEYSDVLYACARFTDEEGNIHYSDVSGFSPEAYAQGRIDKSSNAALVETVKRMVTYGEYARTYFG